MGILGKQGSWRSHFLGPTHLSFWFSPTHPPTLGVRQYGGIIYIFRHPLVWTLGMWGGFLTFKEPNLSHDHLHPPLWPHAGNRRDLAASGRVHVIEKDHLPRTSSTGTLYLQGLFIETWYVIFLVCTTTTTVRVCTILSCQNNINPLPEYLLF